MRRLKNKIQQCRGEKVFAGEHAPFGGFISSWQRSQLCAVLGNPAWKPANVQPACQAPPTPAFNTVATWKNRIYSMEYMISAS